MDAFDDFQIKYMKEIERLCTKIPSANLLTSAEQNSILVYFDSALSVLRRCSDYVSFIVESHNK